VAAQHSLPSGRYSLLGPDFHRLDRTSLRLAHSLDHLVGAAEQRVWEGEAERSRCLEITSMALAHAEIVRARSVRWSNGTLSMPRAAGPLCPRHRRRSWRRIKLAFGPEQNQASGESFNVCRGTSRCVI
jgi:hypothetical protein